MYAQYKVDRGRKDHWAMYPCPQKIDVVYKPLPWQPVDVRSVPKDVPMTAKQVLQTISGGEVTGLSNSKSLMGIDFEIFPVDSNGRNYKPLFATAYCKSNGERAIYSLLGNVRPGPHLATTPTRVGVLGKRISLA